MLTITSSPMKGPFLVRPVCKETDRAIVRELFRQEFYGPLQLLYPDEMLWEIYDNVETDDIYGAYLVFYHERPLFLLEVHPPVQMDLPAKYLSRPGTIGIYCFYANWHDPMNVPAIRTCIDALLNYPRIRRIVTRVNFVTPNDPRVTLFEHAGFRRQAKNPDKSAIYYCAQDTFSLLGKNQNKQLLENSF